MNKKFFVMGAIALAFGGTSVVAADYWLKANVKTVVQEVVVEKPLTENKSLPTIVVAAEPMTYGDDVQADRLKEVPWAAGDMPKGAFSKIDDMLSEGTRAALGPIEVGEPILGSRITGPDGRPSLSAKLTAGMRAITIQVDEYKGVAGFIVPGDRIDVVLTRTFPRVGGDSNSGAVSESTLALDNNGGLSTDGTNVTVTTRLVDNVKVLSVDQVADERQAEPIVVRAVTIEVPPEYARIVAAAQVAGSLSVQLRSAGDSDTGPQLAMPALNIDPAPTASYKRTEPQPEAMTAAPKPRRAQVIVRHGDTSQTFDVTPEGAR